MCVCVCVCVCVCICVEITSLPHQIKINLPKIKFKFPEIIY